MRKETLTNKLRMMSYDRKIVYDLVIRNAMKSKADELEVCCSSCQFSGFTMLYNIQPIVPEPLPGTLEIFDRSKEEAFITKVYTVIREHLDDPEFTVEHLNKAMSMSNTQLFRKLKALTRLTAIQHIRRVRLDRAKVLLKSKCLTVSEIAYQTGFTDPSYFARIFSREVGITPSAFMK